MGLTIEKRKELKQSAAAFLYNFTLMSLLPTTTTTSTDNARSNNEEEEEEEGISDVLVTIICGIINDLESETDETVLLRRLLVVGKIMCPGSTSTTTSNENDNGTSSSTAHKLNPTAIELVKELGYIDIIESLRNGKLSDLLAKVVTEIVNISESFE